MSLPDGPLRAAALAAILGAGLAGCSREESPGLPAPLALEPVVAPAITRLEEAIAAAPEAEAPPGEDPEELDERVTGLVRDLARTQGKWQEVLLEDLASIGTPAVRRLVTILTDQEAEAGLRAAACLALAALDTPRSAERLLEEVETGPESWLRAHAAWNLGRTTQDWIVPRLLLRLKYENDWDTVVWLGVTLAHFGNHSGLEGLYNAASSAPAETVRQSAEQRLAELAARAEVETPEELYRRWFAGELEGPGPSDHHRLEVWRQIAQLSGEHFQLRGVDDGRYVLARGAPWVAEVLGRALSDEDVFTRVHAAQCLERMGRRGHAAGPVLLRALEDPALAPGAADALGGVGYVPALDELGARLAAPHPLELRVACARALGRLWVPEVVPHLRPLLAAAEPPDLRQAAAQSLLSLEAEGGPGLAHADALAAAELLAAAMSDEALDQAAAEAAIARWIETPEAQSLSGAGELLAGWREADQTPPGILPTPEEARTRIALRAALVSDWLATLR